MSCYFCGKAKDDSIYGDRQDPWHLIEGEQICPDCGKEVIFVFGSNLAGRHGKGAALDALKMHGAKYGQGEGLQGGSYALPTKDHSIRVLPIAKIAEAAQRFLTFAADNPTKKFRLTRVGCGNAGFTDKQMGPLFKGYTKNILVPRTFKPFCDTMTL